MSAQTPRPTQRSGGRAQWAVLALAVIAILWSAYLCVLDLPANRLAGDDPRGSRPRRPRAGLVMDDGTVVPVKRPTRPEAVLPTRAALLAERQLTLVLLSNADDREGFPRLESCLRALGAFARPADVAELILIAPAAQRPTFAAQPALAELPFAWRIVPDGELLSRPAAYLQRFTPRAERREAGGRGSGYRLQMLLKLAVAAAVRTEFYVTLDADVLLAQPLTLHSVLTADGRALVQGEAWPYSARHERVWWEAADRALHAGGCVLDARAEDARALFGRTIGVTPAVLSRSISLRAMGRVESANAGLAFGAAWDEILLRLLLQAPTKLNWSEYTLYWTAGCGWRADDGSSALEVLHAQPWVGGKLLYAEEGFGWGDWEAWRPERAFGPDAPALFAVLQSNSGVSPSWANERVAPFLAAAIADHAPAAERDGGAPARSSRLQADEK